ncbi:MAG: NAD-dependent epimerase/dehydratase family protein [Candidatus Omnitrophica bacterium]|jgi:CDP-paratose 2-epimerase|nr:NAD-dependent epimerase/dehydratase family protein [Candidatus Omnitrophota bacterium]
MSVVIISGSCGLIGSEAVSFFAGLGFDVVGIDNNMRKYFFGIDGSIAWNKLRLQKEHKNYRHYSVDIRDSGKVDKIFRKFSKDTALIIHTAAQPSHDWAAREPKVDFTVNANGTLNMLEAARIHCPKAVFIFTSTNKVYGDRPNSLPVEELEKRFELPKEHKFHQGIDESMSIDNCLHSLFGASKVAADILAQEYGKYFGIKTVIFRGGCLTGPAHSGAQLHGFLSYLIKCCISGKTYTIFGYKGKQVRDNIHSFDLVNAFYHFFKNPRCGEVYNIGGGRHANVSVLEAIEICEDISRKRMNYEYSEKSRIGDHIWWISDCSKFKSHYPDWHYKYNIEDTIKEIYQMQKTTL